MNNAPRRCLMANRVWANVPDAIPSFSTERSNCELGVHAAGRTARTGAEGLIV
jgi:hypothetical protein